MMEIVIGIIIFLMIVGALAGGGSPFENGRW